MLAVKNTYNLEKKKTELILTYKTAIYSGFPARKRHRECCESQSVAKKGKDVCVC